MTIKTNPLLNSSVQVPKFRRSMTARNCTEKGWSSVYPDIRVACSSNITDQPKEVSSASESRSVCPFEVVLAVSLWKRTAECRCTAVGLKTFLRICVHPGAQRMACYKPQLISALNKKVHGSCCPCRPEHDSFCALKVSRSVQSSVCVSV